MKQLTNIILEDFFKEQIQNNILLLYQSVVKKKVNFWKNLITH